MPAPVPAEDPEAGTDPASAAEGAPATKPLEKPESKYRIGTSSISVVEPNAIIAALAKLGFQAEEGLETGAGRWEQRWFNLRKGGSLVGTLLIVRPAKTIQDQGIDDTVASPSAAVERHKADGARETLYDPSGEVAVVVIVRRGTKTASGKDLLGELVVQSP